MAAFSFIHAADIHLGSTIQLPQLDLTPRQQDLLAEANFNAFISIVDTAIAEEVDFLLLAGDVYDQQQRSIKATQIFKQQCEKLAENQIDVYMIAGNHDPLNSRKQLFSLPTNVIEFGAQEVEEYQSRDNNLPVANLIGQSYQYQTEPDALHLNYQSSNHNLYNIALLHTQLEAQQSNYIPAAKKELKQNQAVNYWALGHIHQCRIENNENPIIAYPGIPQGRDFGEQNLGGCLLVEVTGNQEASYSFLPTSDFVWRREKINLDKVTEKPSNLDQLVALIQQRAEKLAENYPAIPEDLTVCDHQWRDDFMGYIVEWNITGSGEIHNLLREQHEAAEESLRENLNQNDYLPNQVLTAGIKFNTMPPLPSLEELKSDNPVFAELSQVLSLCNSDLKEGLKSELGEIWETEVDHENINPTNFQLTSQAYEDVLEQAKNLIIEKIMERRD